MVQKAMSDSMVETKRDTVFCMILTTDKKHRYRAAGAPHILEMLPVQRANLSGLWPIHQETPLQDGCRKGRALLAQRVRIGVEQRAQFGKTLLTNASELQAIDDSSKLQLSMFRPEKMPLREPRMTGEGAAKGDELTLARDIAREERK